MLNTRLDRIAAERLDVGAKTMEKAVTAMIGGELSGIKDDMVVQSQVW